MKNHYAANKFVCMIIIRLSTNCLVNVSIRKINVGKEFLRDGHNGLPYLYWWTYSMLDTLGETRSRQTPKEARPTIR